MMLFLLSVSFASASENTDLSVDDEVLTVEENDIQTETINEEITSQTNDNALSANDKTYNDLNGYIAKIDSGMTFKMDSNYTHNGDSDAGHITISKDVTIDGQNHYINANNEKGIFRIEADDVTLTLKNLILKNGISDNGGVIYTKSNANINIINCTFIDNEALEDGGAIYFDSTGTLDIKDSTFYKCKTRITDEASRKHNGGAINTQNGVIKLDNCIFRNCTGGFGYGGAIYMKSECSGITNCVFENNLVRSRFGGSIYVDTSNKNGIAIDNCSFTDNTCRVIDKKSGGGTAIFYDGSGLLRLTNSNFTRNMILGEPSDIKTKYESTRATYDSDGGAVYSNHDIEIGNCRFIGNHALDHGGAVYTAEGIRWLDGPSVFINNSAGHANSHIANKGGAIYAGKFLNDAKGHVFINNTCWYGAAIYINNKNEVTFDSCVFRENYAFNYDGKSAPGAAVYIDSASSKIHLINNVIVDNTGNADRGFYNCGVYGTVEHNWFGSNSPNFNDGYLVEWHRFKSNDKRSDSNYLKLCIVSDTNSVYESNATLTAYFVDCKGNNFTGKLNWWDASFFSDGAFDEFSDLKVGDNKATVVFTPIDAMPAHTVSAEVDYQTVSTTIKQKGNFTWLQEQIDAATGVYNLTRDLTYSIGMDNIVNGIYIGKEITINGNGHKLNALGQTRIFDVHWSNVVINNITFENGMEIKDGGGAIFIDGVENVTVTNSRFITNRAEAYGGAVYSRNGNHLEITNSEFILNYEGSYGGGAVLLSTPNSVIKNSAFKTNKATQGGAIDIRADNVTVDGCVFTNNTAWGSDFGGSAINNFGDNTIVSNSVFLDNKAEARYFDSTIKDDTLILTMYGYNNYMNAIDSSSEIKFSNVTYWNGEVTTGDNPLHTNNESGIAVTIEIFDSNGKAIKKIATTSDKEGLIKFDYSLLPDGNYTFRAVHLDDNYYSELYDNGEFTVIKPTIYGSEVTINLTDKQEFKFGECNITFEVTNRTDVSYLITDEEGTEIIIDEDTNLSYVILNLPANDEDEYYGIHVINWGNKTVNASSDSKLFRILKESSEVTVNPIADAIYDDPITVTYSGDGTTYNVTAYDAWGNMIFSQITNKNSIKIPGGFAVGTYNVTVINYGDENKTKSKNSTKFNITPKTNNIIISAEDTVYGKGVLAYISATADGEYIAHINSTNVTINVNNGYGSVILDLAAGTYTTNVTFNRADYINVIETYNFTVQKAQSNVEISIGNVTSGQNTTVLIMDNFPTEYNVIIKDSGNNTVFAEVINDTSFVIPSLDVGQYHLTVTNIGNENITESETSRTLDVTKDNYVTIIVYDSVYGRELDILVIADVDGFYTVDINGTELTIEVVDGIGFNDELQLPAGEYYANVTYGNPDYNNIIENTTFIVDMAESNVQISDIEDVTYPDGVIIEYQDDYNATFTVVIFNENDDVVYEFKTNATTVEVLDLAAGNYTVMVTNEGNENIMGLSEFKNFTVLKATPKVNVTTGNVTYPEDVVITVITDISGSYDISFAGESGTVYLDANVEKIMEFKNIAPGEYEFTLIFEESENYTGVNATVPVRVSKINTTIKSDAVVDDKTVTITVNVDENATGLIEIEIAGKKFYAPITDGKAVFSNDYAKGNYVANITYPGDEYYESAKDTVMFTISEIVPTLDNTTIEMDVSTDENVASITVTVNSDATGLIEINIDSDAVYLPVNNGEVFYEVLLPAGNYTATATYLGDEKYNPNTTSSEFEVFDHIKQNTTITATPKVDENTVTITVNVNPNATGFVEITIAGKKYYAPVENGKAEFTNDYANGTYTANITYLGDDNYNTANTKTQFSVTETEPELENTTIEMDISTDENIATITVTVNTDATGLIEINIDGDAVYLPINNGKVNYEVLLPGGNYTATATYLGDANYNPNTTSSEFEVFDHIKQNTTITATPKVDENTVTITVNVNENATGFVEITIAGKKYYVPVENGEAEFTNDYANGTYTANITYLGDDNYNTANTKTQFSVTETEPTLDNTTIEIDVSSVENDVTIKVTVNPNATGLIEINIDGNAVYLPVNNGEVIYEVLLAGGNYTATATYLGDANYNPNTTAKDFEVFDHTKQNTTISATPKVDENTVTITVNVDANATGFVEITIAGNKFYVPVENGKAVFTNKYAPGTYSASITYLGDDNFNTANTKTQFNIINQTPEKKNTTIEIDVETADNNVTITVNVDESATGLIEVNIDGNAAYLPVTNGQAVYEAVAPAGNYTATATYLGDDIFNSNTTSASFTVTDHVVENTTFEVEYSVNGTNVTITITSNVDGEVTLYLDGVESSVKLDNGTVTFTVPSMDYGEHSLVISYPGDYNHKPTVDVKQIYLEAFDTKFANITINKDTLTAYLVISTGDVLANQSITLIIDGNEYNATTNADGMIQIEDILNSIVELKFEGDGPFMPTSVEINLKNITVERETTEIMSKDLTQYACDFYEGERGGNFTFRLIDSKGKAIAGETIYIGYNGVTYNRTTDANGYAHVQINLKNAGLYTFVVVYLGSDNYEASMSVHKITINKKKTAITAPAKTYKVATKTKSYTVTLKTNKGSSADGKTYLAKGKKITLKVNGKTYTAKTNAKGQATFKITNLKKKGKFTAVIKFAGDNTYNAASQKSKLTIK